MKSILKALIPERVRARMRHYGTEFECNYCGAKLKRFLPRGQHADIIVEADVLPSGVRDASCPFCGSYDRDRLLLFFLRERTDVFQRPIKLLHIAPEPTAGKVLAEAPNIDYLSGDLDGKLAMSVVDVTDIQHPDATFDAVICNHVLEHVPDDAKAMRELLRVLKPGGWAILQVPIGYKLVHSIEDPTVSTDEERLERFGQGDHVRIYSFGDYVQRLRDAGWELEVIDFPTELGESKVHRFGLHPREKIFFGRKAGGP